MIRLTIPVLFAVAVTVLGCQGQDAKVPLDPFYGQTKIAPPATGEIARRPHVDPAYPKSASTSVPVESIQPPLGGTATAKSGLAQSQRTSKTTSGAEQPSSATSGDRIAIPVSACRELSPAEILAARSPSQNDGTQQPSDAASSAAASGGLPKEPQRVVQTLSPREKSVAGQPSSHTHPRPTLTSPRHGPVDINDLPPVDRGATTLRDDQVQQASAAEEDASLTVRIPTHSATTGSQGRFGWADDYSRLRGQLEYLESDRAWKLRYIPIDRKTDDFGGSVVIEDPASISGFERGDFVEVRGRIAENPEDGTDFAPIYQVTSIRSLTR